MSVQYDITKETLEEQGARLLHAGDDYPFAVTVTIDGTPALLTGEAKVWLTIKEDSVKPDGDALLQLVGNATPAEGDKIVITDGDAGQFTLQFLAADTTDLEGVWPYDLQVKARVAAGGDEYKIVTVAWGKIEFLPNLTRAVS